MWPIDETHAGQLLEIGVDDEVRLSLKERPSTGYLWMPEAPEIVDLRHSTGAKHQVRKPNDAQGSLFETIPDETTFDTENTTPVPPSGHMGLIRSEYETADTTLLRDGVGASGNRYLTLRALRRGEAEFRIGKARPWQTQIPPVQIFSARVRIVDKPTGDADRGYLATAKYRDITLTESAI